MTWPAMTVAAGSGHDPVPVGVRVAVRAVAPADGNGRPAVHPDDAGGRPVDGGGLAQQPLVDGVCSVVAGRLIVAGADADGSVPSPVFQHRLVPRRQAPLAAGAAANSSRRRLQRSLLGIASRKCRYAAIMM